MPLLVVASFWPFQFLLEDSINVESSQRDVFEVRLDVSPILCLERIWPVAGVDPCKPSDMAQCLALCLVSLRWSLVLWTLATCFIVWMEDPTEALAIFACCSAGWALIDELLSDCGTVRSQLLDGNVACVRTLESTDDKGAPKACFVPKLKMTHGRGRFPNGRFHHKESNVTKNLLKSFLILFEA